MHMRGKSLIVKLAGFWVAFLLLHFAYDALPVLPIKLIAATDESFFQHAKIGFLSYALVSLVEYLVIRPSAARRRGFLFSRLFSTTVLPWLIFLLWFTAPAYYGRSPNSLLEVVFANGVLLVAGWCALMLEDAMQGATYNAAFRVMIVLLFLISVSLYVIFTFKLPWHDVFVDPTAFSGQVPRGLTLKVRTGGMPN